MTTRTLSDFKRPEVLVDPYPMFRELRETAPVFYDEARRRWLLTRYRDVNEVLRDDERFSAENDIVTSSMLVSDPPQHTRLRALVSKAFTPRAIAEFVPRIERIVGELLDAAEARGSMDAISDFAYPLPITIIADVLGVDADRREFFRDASQKVTVAVGPIDDPAVWARAKEGREALMTYFDDLIARRRREPRDDMVTALIRAEDAGDSLNHRELMAMLLLLLIGGHETTVNLIANGLLALLRHPEERSRFTGTAGIEATAIEEMLRFDAPVQYVGRVTKVEVELSGVRIPAGQVLRLMLAAANRDPEVFENPDRLDLTRTPCPHLSFGMGIHTCLGGPLARMEGRIALSSLLRRFPHARMGEGDLRYRPATVFRGLESFPIHLN